MATLTQEILHIFGENVNVKQIYEYLLKLKVEKNGSLIPSRNKKNTRGVEWNISWKNLQLLTGLDPEQKCFAWKLTQDMVAVGRRIHRKGTDKSCKRTLGNGNVCNLIDTLEHFFFDCAVIRDCGQGIGMVLSLFTGRMINEKQILSLSFNCRQRSKRKLGLWFVINAMKEMFDKKIVSKSFLWKKLLVEINPALSLQLKIGTREDISELKRLLELDSCRPS